MACAKKGCGVATELTGEQKQILAAMATRTEPCGCKEIAEASGMESKAVSCKLTALKNQGYVESPARCKYAITAAGRAAATA
ncbi:MAG: hypothetical protein OEV91_08980 [Desulfobulbaceae bacterium]|nr:hypothetical protein [Desulfobulbaceae bacterium]